MTTPRAAQPLQIGSLRLANRLVGTPHASGAVAGGIPARGDDDYWRRCAAGGAAMLIVGGTVVSPGSTNRNGNITEAWRPEVLAGLEARARAITEEGAVAACQLVHLGRETLGAELWSHPVAPSAVRSPREPTRPRALSPADVDEIVDAFRVSAVHAWSAGFPVVELHAAHGYLLAQFLSPITNVGRDAATVSRRVQILDRIASAVRDACPGVVLGVRVSTEGDDEAGLSLDGLCEVLPHLSGFDYVNVTVGVRTTYVRDMAVTDPPLLDAVGRLRAAVAAPLLVSQAFRTGASIDTALRSGADLVGVARPLIADPNFPRKILTGREASVRPCVSCNEDCRAFDPVLLCSVNPELAPPGHSARPAHPLTLGPTRSSGDRRRIAVVGAGPAGLECAMRLGPDRNVTLFEQRERIGGQLATAADAPHRSGWRRLLDFYSANMPGVAIRLGHTVSAAELEDFDEVVLAVGAVEMLPPEAEGTNTLLSSQALAGGGAALRGAGHVVVIDDGFGLWPAASAVEAALAAGAGRVTVLTPAAAFASGLPAEGRVQYLRRLSGAPVDVRVLSSLVAVSDGLVEFENALSGERSRLDVDRIVVAGERRSIDWSLLAPRSARVHVIGDALVPRKVAHAVAEGRSAACEYLSTARG
ncbi:MULTISPECIES: FAD-dependent oxidoreductase [unclassified Rhodococcus (in: high G+C Gram-positive bacteria)]|uniref:oxidoreductase n=1 Tax=unclassified Rhodococcus (in: high G+C Gram-positive bacteria) TaxID=192944 RepID=UPI00163AEE5B|nr:MULTISPECIES: FAD-dependent oxidoreductase [unclassified Rhodococcus (in: high G+C Gram-positive bacteria)]MBC2639931.1 FAD-dependent oxidoreductase [Rhodococcus sp. 3A]MBC2895322.1 FAD-dependent oxidoreductase [Rhodococcus sp. 4CII]